MSQVSTFLNWLLGLGPKLPEAARLLQQLMADVQALVALAGKPAFQAGAEPQLSADEQVLLDQCEAKLQEHTVGGKTALDGSLLKQLIAFVQAHPQLLALLLSLIKP